MHAFLHIWIMGSGSTFDMFINAWRISKSQNINKTHGNRSHGSAIHIRFRRHWSTLQNMGDKRLCWDLKRCTIYSSPNKLRATEQRNGCKTFQSYITCCRITHILRATTSEEQHALDENGQHKSPNLMSISREIWLVKLFRQFHTSSIQYTNTEKKILNKTVVILFSVLKWQRKSSWNVRRFMMIFNMFELSGKSELFNKYQKLIKILLRENHPYQPIITTIICTNGEKASEEMWIITLMLKSFLIFSQIKQRRSWALELFFYVHNLFMQKIASSTRNFQQWRQNT